MEHRNNKQGLIIDHESNHTDGMIFKVQLSLFTNNESPQIYVHSQDKGYVWLQDYNSELYKTFGNTTKSFWYGYINPQRKIVITSKAPWQEW